MQNTTSWGPSVQNAAYCTVLAAFAEKISSVRNNCEAGRQHQSKCNCRSLDVPIQGLKAGSTRAITGRGSGLRRLLPERVCW